MREIQKKENLDYARSRSPWYMYPAYYIYITKRWRAWQCAPSLVQPGGFRWLMLNEKRATQLEKHAFVCAGHLFLSSAFAHRLMGILCSSIVRACEARSGGRGLQSRHLEGHHSRKRVRWKTGSESSHRRGVQQIPRKFWALTRGAQHQHHLKHDFAGIQSRNSTDTSID